MKLKFNLRLGERLANYRRVIRIAKKPTKEDFAESSRICLIGMAVIGLIGFAIYIVSVLFPYL